MSLVYNKILRICFVTLYKIIIIFVKKYFYKFYMNMDNIQFTSRINFVNEKTFDNFRKGIYVDFREPYKTELFGKKIRTNIVKADEFYTDTVRTCTAGGIINHKTGDCTGFHIFDNYENSQRTNDILEEIFKRVKNPDRAFILGGKNLTVSEYSMPIFEKICNGIKKRVANVTIFKEHIFPYSETNMHYSAKEDTWTIQSMYRPLTDIKSFDILSKEDMVKCFKEIEIADGDVLSFGK